MIVACSCHWSSNNSPCGWALVGIVFFVVIPLFALVVRSLTR